VQRRDGPCRLRDHDDDDDDVHLFASRRLAIQLYRRCLHMRSRVYVTVARPSVRPSVPSINSSNGSREGVAAEHPVGWRYRSIAAGALRAPCNRHAGAQQQMWVASRRELTEEAQHGLVYCSDNEMIHLW